MLTDHTRVQAQFEDQEQLLHIELRGLTFAGLEAHLREAFAIPGCWPFKVCYVDEENNVVSM